LLIVQNFKSTFSKNAFYLKLFQITVGLQISAYGSSKAVIFVVEKKPI